MLSLRSVVGALLATALVLAAHHARGQGADEPIGPSPPPPPELQEDRSRPLDDAVTPPPTPAPMPRPDIASHAFVGFGPTVFHDVVQKREDSAAKENLATTVGARFIVGGWL